MTLGTLLLGIPKYQAERELVGRGLALVLQQGAYSAGTMAKKVALCKVGCEMHQDCSNMITDRTFSKSPWASFCDSGHREEFP